MIYFRPLLGNIASLVALILLFLCLFAGSSRQMLPDASILSVGDHIKAGSYKANQ